MEPHSQNMRIDMWQLMSSWFKRLGGSSDTAPSAYSECPAPKSVVPAALTAWLQLRTMLSQLLQQYMTTTHKLFVNRFFPIARVCMHRLLPVCLALAGPGSP